MCWLIFKFKKIVCLQHSLWLAMVFFLTFLMNKLLPGAVLFFLKQPHFLNLCWFCERLPMTFQNSHFQPNVILTCCYIRSSRTCLPCHWSCHLICVTNFLNCRQWNLTSRGKKSDMDGTALQQHTVKWLSFLGKKQGKANLLLNCTLARDNAYSIVKKEI